MTTILRYTKEKRSQRVPNIFIELTFCRYSLNKANCFTFFIKKNIILNKKIELIIEINDYLKAIFS